MKKRYVIPAAGAVALSAVALLLLLARGNVTKGDYRDYAAERFRGTSEEKYTELAVYPTEEKYLTPDRAMALKNQMAENLRKESITPEGHLLVTAYTERSVTVNRDTRSTDAVATVYFGDFFSLHPAFPIEGGFAEESATAVEYCVIDEYAAWRLFGSTDVCGLDVEIGGHYYTVTAVLPALRGEYAEQYGEFPRIYVRYDSAAMRSSQICFTAMEAAMPDPVTDFAKGVFADCTTDLGKTHVVTGRFGAAALYEKCKQLTALGVPNGEVYPYEENIARIREAKCAYLFLAECICFAVAALCALWIFFNAWYDVQKKMQAVRKAKHTHAVLD